MEEGFGGINQGETPSPSSCSSFPGDSLCLTLLRNEDFLGCAADPPFALNSLIVIIGLEMGPRVVLRRGDDVATLARRLFGEPFHKVNFKPKKRRHNSRHENENNSV